MEYIEGVTLEKVIQDRVALAWREVAELGIQICDALHYAHERGVVHRDMKPSNLMVTPDGKIKLTDFGIAKDLDATALTATGRTLGTAAYMAPEQIRGTPPISHKTDLYSLGILFFQMLTGKMPFEGNTPVVLMHAHLNEPPPRPSTRVAEIPKALDELVLSLMAKAPADRPWDAAAVSMALTELRDKAERGAAIAMVWPSSGQAATKRSRSGEAADGGSAASEQPRKKRRKATTLAGLAPSALATSRGLSEGLGSLRISRAALETALLVAALLAVGGFIGYWIYPPSAGYLYSQAEGLMASKHRSEWVRAREEFLDPLDKRFPNNPFRDQTQAWRDKIFLDDAEGRAKFLSSDKKLSNINDPQNNAERQFVLTFALARDASERGDDLGAKRHWEEMAQSLKPDEPEDRGWYLLAQQRVKTVEAAIEDRRRYVEKELDAAMIAELGGRTAEANSIRNTLITKFGQFTDLADLLARAQPVVKSPETKTTTPREAPPNPSSPSSDDGKSSAADPPDQPKTSGDPDGRSGSPPGSAP
jgi:serine/threonine-protein kinase